MPNEPEALEDGIRFERAGLLDRALGSYRSIAETSSDPDSVAAALTHEADVHRTLCDWDASIAAARKAQGVARAARLPQRLADATIAEVNVLMSRGDFGAVWVPAFRAKDLAIALEPHLAHLAAEKRDAGEPALARVVRGAWLLDAAGDVGNRQQVEAAYSTFTAGVTDVLAAFQ